MLCSKAMEHQRSSHPICRHPVGFHSQMVRFNALLSGSFALQFFDRVVWKDSDLDVYVQSPWLRSDNTSLLVLGQYLVSTDGFNIGKTQKVEEWRRRGFRRVISNQTSNSQGRMHIPFHSPQNPWLKHARSRQPEIQGCWSSRTDPGHCHIWLAYRYNLERLLHCWSYELHFLEQSTRYSLIRPSTKEKLIKSDHWTTILDLW